MKYMRRASWRSCNCSTLSNIAGQSSLSAFLRIFENKIGTVVLSLIKWNLPAYVEVSCLVHWFSWPYFLSALFMFQAYVEHSDWCRTNCHQGSCWVGISQTAAGMNFIFVFPLIILMVMTSTEFQGRKDSWFIPTQLATDLSASLSDSSSSKEVA